MKISNYSLNYSEPLSSGEMDLFGFLSLCGQLDLEGASLHIRNLPDTRAELLKKIRRGYLDNGLSVSMFSVSTNFGLPESQHEAELAKAREAIRVAAFLGAPLRRVFAGRPPNEGDRDAALRRSAAGIRRVAELGAEVGLPIALQNHNHGALCGTGKEVIRFFNLVDHPNSTFMLDTGEFAGSRGASGKARAGLAKADYLESIRETASLARYVRVKFYNPRADGSEPWINYDEIFDILRGVHYQGFVDIVYQPGATGDDPLAAIPRIIGFLRSKIEVDDSRPSVARAKSSARYAGLETGKYFVETAARRERSLVFLEGPAVDRSGDVYFTNMSEDRIMKWSPKESKLSIFREKSNAANGLLFDRERRLLACETNGRVTRTDMQTGEVTVLADEYNSNPLGGPNDLDADGRGRVYFTSRLANRDPDKGNVNSVYRIDAPGKVARVLHWPNIDKPNGIVISPDDKILYLIDADGAANRARRVRGYELRRDGTVGKEWLVYDFYPGRGGDGMCIDAEGNLYVAAGLHRRRGSSETLDTRPGIHVISPDGKLVAFAETSEDTITNCTFGGPDRRTLYVTCGKLLLSLRTRIPGKSLAGI